MQHALRDCAQRISRSRSKHRQYAEIALPTRRYFLHRLRGFRNYVEFFREELEDTLASYNRSLADDKLNITRFGGRRDQWANLANEFPQYHRKAFFLMIFAMLEDDLTEFCRSTAAEQTLAASVSTAPGRGIERAKGYFTKMAGFPFPASTPEWQLIKLLSDVRNVLIHAAGYLEAANAQHERVRKVAAAAGSGLLLHHHARVQISLEPDFLPTVIATLERFYERLLAVTKRKP